MFITFEGIEGSGKSTHSKWAKEYLQGKGFTVVHSREPGGTKLGETLRSILLGKETAIVPFAEVLLFAADRVQHVEEIIRPALKEGHIMICDRYIDSTSAYQSGGRGLPQDWIKTLNQLSTQGLIPDLTILLDCQVDIGLMRARHKGGMPDRFESQNVAFYERVRSGYLQIARMDPGRVRVINSAGSPEVSRTQIAAILDEYLRRSGK